MLSKNLDESNDYFPMVIRRAAVLENALTRLSKPAFNPARRLKVTLLLSYV